MLDSRLGKSAWQPTDLLAILSWEYHEKGANPFNLRYPDFFDFQHQALLRLLDLQGREFGPKAIPRAKNGTYIDHVVAQVSEHTNSGITVIGTGTLKPVHFEGRSIFDPDGYWQMERFTFASDGRLLSRESYNTQ